MTDLLNYGGVCRTAPATAGLLIIRAIRVKQNATLGLCIIRVIREKQNKYLKYLVQWSLTALLFSLLFQRLGSLGRVNY